MTSLVRLVRLARNRLELPSIRQSAMTVSSVIWLSCVRTSYDNVQSHQMLYHSYLQMTLLCTPLFAGLLARYTVFNFNQGTCRAHS